MSDETLGMRERVDALELGLRELGPPLPIRNVMAGAIDYVRLLDLTEEDGYALRLISNALDEELAEEEDPDKALIDARHHALRALAQYQAPDSPLATMEFLLRCDDPTVEELTDDAAVLFGLAGGIAVPMLMYAAFTDTFDHSTRMVAAEGMVEVAWRHEHERDAIHRLLVDILSKPENNSPLANAFIVYTLVRLGARDAAETIEKAFAAGTVDYALLGGWDEVRDQFGVPDAGRDARAAQAL